MLHKGSIIHMYAKKSLLLAKYEMDQCMYIAINKNQTMQCQRQIAGVGASVVVLKKLDVTKKLRIGIENFGTLSPFTIS